MKRSIRLKLLIPIGFLLFFLFTKCHPGMIPQSCGGGKVWIPKDAYPDVALEFKNELSNTIRILDTIIMITNLTTKTEAIELKEKANQSNIALQAQLEANYLPLSLNPCDATTIELYYNYLEFITGLQYNLKEENTEIEKFATNNLTQSEQDSINSNLVNINKILEELFLKQGPAGNGDINNKNFYELVDSLNLSIENSLIEFVLLTKEAIESGALNKDQRIKCLSDIESNYNYLIRLKQEQPQVEIRMSEETLIKLIKEKDKLNDL